MAQPTPMLCNAIANNPLLREEGYTETVGDLLMACTGGPPTAPGSVVPAANLTVTLLNTRITSKVTAATASNAVLFTESLLLVSYPGHNVIAADPSDNHETESGGAGTHGRTTERVEEMGAVAHLA